MRRLLLLLSLVSSLAFAGEAAAAEVVLADGQGRPIHFDVRAEGADPEWYAALLRAAPHGDEIATVEINVVSWDELFSICGREAGGCYSRDVIVVPAAETAETAHTLLHEYAHHLDRSMPVAGVREPNGGPEWWRARGMAELVRIGSVARSYALGWDRSIAEIFAEDYARLALGESRHKIAWLGEPDEDVLAALKADLGLGPAPAAATPPAIRPVSIERRGTLAPRRRIAIPFGLLGPGRRVTATASIAARGTLEIRCAGTRIALRTLTAGTRKVTIVRRGLGPAECTATLTNSSTARGAYTLVVGLSIEPGT